MLLGNDVKFDVFHADEPSRLRETDSQYEKLEFISLYTFFTFGARRKRRTPLEGKGRNVQRGNA
jgi:hypothetical protein